MSPSSKAGQSSNRGWEDTHRNGASGGKPSYRPQGGGHKYGDKPSANHHNYNGPSASPYGMLNPFSLVSTGNHNDPMWTPGIKLKHDNQDRKLLKAPWKSKHNEPGIPGMDLNHDAQDPELAKALRDSEYDGPGRIPGMDLNHDAQDPELAKALRESKYDEPGRIPGLNRDAQDREPAIRESKFAYDSDVIKAPDRSALDQQMDLDDPSPSPTTPVQVKVDAASSNLALELQRFYDEEDRQLGAERSALRKHAQAEFFDCGICFENLHRENIAQFASCKHRYCRSCLREHVSSTLEQRRYPIICPECKAKNVPNPAG